MANPSPTCTVQDAAGVPAATTNGVNVTPADLITIQLSSLAGVTSWAITIAGQDELVSPPTLTVNSTTKTCTYTAPAAGSALLFKSVVNQGVDANGQAQPSYTTTFTVYTLTAASKRVIASNERAEGNASFGWVAPVNSMIRAGGGSFTAPTGTGLAHVTSASLDGASYKGTANQVLFTNAGATDTAWATIGTDITMLASGVATVIQLTGSGGIVSVPSGNTIQWANGASGGTIKMLAAASDILPRAFTILGEYAFASATGSNRQAGNVIVDLGIPTNGLTGTASEASFAVTRNGSRVANIGQANDVAWNCLWLGGDPNAASSSGTSVIMTDNSSFSYVNGPSGGAVGFRLSGSAMLYVTATAVRIFGNGTTGLGGGNGVVNLATCVTEPTSAPTGGALFWQDTTRGLHFANPSTQFVDWMVAPTFSGTANTQQNKFWQYGANVRTTNATTTTILTIPLATSNTNGCIQVTVTGRDQASGTVADGVSFSQLVQFKNTVGTVTAAATQATQLKANDTSMAACTLTYAISLTNVLVQVTGLAGVTIDWTATANVIIN